MEDVNPDYSVARNIVSQTTTNNVCRVVKVYSSALKGT